MQLFFLCTGNAWIADEALSAADLPHAWASVRDAVLNLYGAQVPGCRPHAWWAYEAPEPRRCVVGPHDCPQRDRVLRDHKGGKFFYGVPGVFCCPRCWTEQHETQARFLRRHRLLLPAEESVIPTDLQACDRWAVAQYADDHPTPWPPGTELDGCARVLAEGV